MRLKSDILGARGDAGSRGGTTRNKSRVVVSFAKLGNATRSGQLTVRACIFTCLPSLPKVTLPSYSFNSPTSSDSIGRLKKRDIMAINMDSD